MAVFSGLVRRGGIGWLVFLLLVTCVTACKSTPSRTARNEPICPAGSVPVMAISPAYRLQEQCMRQVGTEQVFDPAPSLVVPRARQQFAKDDPDVPDVFVGLAISGGGSRAAVFGLAVMEQLHELGILQHVSAISTTSGGGLPGAWYATKGADPDWEAASDLMATDFLGKWLRRNVQPGQILTVATTDKDRSDLMAEVFDAELFKEASYSDLGAFSVGKAPIWLANATEVGHSRRFTFSDREFDRMNSDLNSFPISHAVMASAAFPGVFNSVTLRDYPSTLIQDGSASTSEVQSFKHLIDGGPTDNLGIEALLELAASHHEARSGAALPAGSSQPPQGKCLLLIVDAHPRGVPNRYALRSDLRGVTGRLVDTNFLDAVNALLAVRRTDLLSYLGLEDGGPFGRRRAPQFVYFDAPRYASRVGQAVRVGAHEIDPIAYDAMEAGEIAARYPVARERFRCAAWHINLSGLEAVRDFSLSSDGSVMPVQRSPELDEQRALHERLVSQIDTNFRLAGPKGCEVPILRQALAEAASVLVMEDYHSRKAACDWVRTAGLSADESCGVYVTPSSISRMPLAGRVAPLGMGTPGGPADESVGCAGVESPAP